MDTNEKKKVFNRVGLAMFVYVIIINVAQTALVWVTEWWRPDLLYDSAFILALSFVSMYVISLPALLLIMRKVPNGERSPEKLKKLTLQQFLKIILVGYGIAMAVSYLNSILLSIVELLLGSELSSLTDEMLTGMDLLPMIIYTVVAAPIVEELLFRKYLYKKLIGLGGKTYIVFSAFLFGLFHMNFSQILYAFLLGLVQAALMYYTGKIWYSIIMHMVFNFFGGAVPMIIDEYMAPYVSYLWLGVTAVAMICGIVIFARWYKAQKAWNSLKFASRFYFGEPDDRFSESPGEPPYEAGSAGIIGGADFGSPESFMPSVPAPEFCLDFESGDGGSTLQRLRSMFLNPGVILFTIVAIITAISALLLV